MSSRSLNPATAPTRSSCTQVAVWAYQISSVWGVSLESTRSLVLIAVASMYIRNFLATSRSSFSSSPWISSLCSRSTWGRLASWPFTVRIRSAYLANQSFSRASCTSFSVGGLDAIRMAGSSLVMCFSYASRKRYFCGSVGLGKNPDSSGGRWLYSVAIWTIWELCDLSCSVSAVPFLITSVVGKTSSGTGVVLLSSTTGHVRCLLISELSSVYFCCRSRALASRPLLPVYRPVTKMK